MDIFGANENNKTEIKTLYWKWAMETGSTQAEIDANDLLDSAWMGDRIVLGIQATGRQVTESQTEGQCAVTFDANGGTLQGYGNSSQMTKNVAYGENYGTLPTPTREGYTFGGWNGKNLFSISSIEKNPSSTSFDKTTKRIFENNTHTVGLAFNNYYQKSNVSDVVITSNSVSFSSKSGYGVGFSISADANHKYSLSYDATVNSGDSYPYASIMYYSEDGTFIRQLFSFGSRHKEITFITPSNMKYLVITFCDSGSSNDLTNLTFSNIQLEENSSATAYEPYYITSSTTVTQNKNHTLTAIWETIN